MYARGIRPNSVLRLPLLALVPAQELYRWYKVVRMQAIRPAHLYLLAINNTTLEPKKTIFKLDDTGGGINLQVPPNLLDNRNLEIF